MKALPEGWAVPGGGGGGEEERDVVKPEVWQPTHRMRDKYTIEKGSKDDHTSLAKGTVLSNWSGILVPLVLYPIRCPPPPSQK